MIPTEQIAEIRRLYYAEHWKIGTIAAQLGLHPDTVRSAVATDSSNQPKAPRPRVTDPYLAFIRETLERYPRLRATRIFEMIRSRGYAASVVQVRRLVAQLGTRVGESRLLTRTRVAPHPGRASSLTLQKSNLVFRAEFSPPWRWPT